MVNNTETRVWKVCTDGGCPANPGPGAFAFVIDTGAEKITRSGFMETATNNQAEYRAVTAALIFLLTQYEAGLPDEVAFWSDSEVIVRQLNGVYKVNDALRPFYLEASSALAELRKKTAVGINWFKRENNEEADSLCNDSLRRHGIEIVSKNKKFGRSPK